MGKLKVKSKGKTASIVDTSVDYLEEARVLVPEATKLHDELEAAQAVVKAIYQKLAPLEDLIIGYCDDGLAQTEKTVLVNGEHVMDVGACRMSRKIEDTDAVILALEGIQEGLALQLASFGIGDLGKYFSEIELNKLTKQSYGKRGLKYKA